MASGKVKCEQLCRLNGSLMTNGEVEAGHLQIDGQNMGGKSRVSRFA
jgi:cytoskeletal protein CcmA (bactofilin family)